MRKLEFFLRKSLWNGNNFPPLKLFPIIQNIPKPQKIFSLKSKEMSSNYRKSCVIIFQGAQPFFVPYL